jgi:L-lysine exporter family protein LysE/ArgO
VTSSSSQLILGAFGSIMLIYTGFRNSINKNVNTDLFLSNSKVVKKSFQTDFLLAIANPINFVFWTGIYGTLLSLKASKLSTPLLLLVFIFVGIAISNFSFAAVSSVGKGYLKPNGVKWVSITSGLILIGYGLWIGYTRISHIFV